MTKSVTELLDAVPAGPTWQAPRAFAPVRAELELPGSKSLTNRALVLAALSEEPVLIRRPLRARDTELMADALRALGIAVEDLDDGSWRVVPDRPRGPAQVDCGLAGTVMRFLPPLAALGIGDITFDGDPRARERPMRPVLEGLRGAGVRIEDDGRHALPFTVCGTGSVPGGLVSLDASASSQFVSGLLLAAPRFEAGLTINHVGPPVPSLPHIAMTMAMLAEAGGSVRETASGTWEVLPGPLQLADLQIEPDLSNAAPFLAAAVVTGGEVRVRHWPQRSTQPGILLPLLLERMGASVRQEGDTLVVSGGGRIVGLEQDLRDVGELVPVLAAVAAVASTPSRFRGIAHLRGHETDRLAALRQELHGMGADITEFPDGLVINPRPLHGTVFDSYADHRMATAGAVLGLVVDDVRVVDIDTTAKTLPDFAGRWAAMLAGGTT